ncbi:metallophosphoesterase family protein [Marinobacter alexandrii]
MQIGVIADTHSKTRPEALEALEGSDLILHAGDVAEKPGQIYFSGLLI